MIAPPQRRLKLSDIMVLVGMVAAGLASLRGIALDDFFRRRSGLLLNVRQDLISPLLPCGLVWTLAILLLGLGHSWPARLHLIRQPGVIARAAAAMVAVAGALALLVVIGVSFYTKSSRHRQVHYPIPGDHDPVHGVRCHRRLADAGTGQEVASGAELD